MTALLSLGIRRFIEEHEPESIIFPLDKAQKLALEAGIKMLGPCKEVQEYGMDNQVRVGEILFYTGDWPDDVRGKVRFYKNRIVIVWKAENINSIITQQGTQKVQYQPHFTDVEERSDSQTLLDIFGIKVVEVKLREFNKRVVEFSEPDWKKIEIAGFPCPMPSWYCFEKELEEYANSLHSYGTRHGPLGEDEL